MKTNDDIILENAYQKILERYDDIDNDHESLFGRYETEFDTFLNTQCRTADSNGGLDYDTDESGELFFYLPSIRFSSDVNIDRDMDIQSQVQRVKPTIENFLVKNGLQNLVDNVSVGHSADDRIEEEDRTGTENEWIGVTIYTKEDIVVNEDEFQNLLKKIKFINDFLLNLTTYPQFKKL